MDVQFNGREPMPEREAAQHFWENRNLYAAMLVFMLACLAKHLTSNEPLNKRRMAGEFILAGIGAAIFHATALVQELTGPVYWLLIFFGSLGGLRGMEWVFKIITAIKKAPL